MIVTGFAHITARSGQPESVQFFFTPKEGFTYNDSVYVPGMRYTVREEDAELAKAMEMMAGLQLVEIEEP